jgi:hypothetical protein
MVGLGVAALLWLLGTAWMVATAGAVTVDANTAVVLDQQQEISSRLFGVTAFEGFPSVIADRDYRARLAVLRPGCIRLPGSVAWCAPAQYDPKWYETPAADWEFSQVLLFGSRYPIGRFLPVVRELGAEPMCSLGNPPAYLQQKDTANPANPSDFDRWAEMCAGYVGLWRKHDPKLRLVQVWNEPNSSWFRDPRTRHGGPSPAELHVQMANKVACAIKARFPDILVGGPVLCWPPAWPPHQKDMQPWYTWDIWTIPWLRGTRDTIDFFDFHVYNVTPEDLAVQLEMLESAARKIQGRHLPVWITEHNNMLSPEARNDPKALWNGRILPYERRLLRAILPQADKVEGNLYHDLHASGYTLLPRGADDPDPMYWLFWVLRDLRGWRVAVENPDPDVLAFAAIEDDRVTIVLFNDSAAVKDVPLKVTMPCTYCTGPIVRAIGEGPDGGCQRLQLGAALKCNGGNADGSISLPAHATASVSFLMNTFGTPRATRTVQELFGDATKLMLDARAIVNIDVPELPDGVHTRLRLGLLGPAGDESICVSWNGRELPAKATALQDLPLDRADVKPHNCVEVWCRQPSGNPCLALAFASVVVE